ncbi:MAG TPA: protein kinase [Myxococcales bacterium]|nr:protein kinase [Myxococcales bacterium]
MPAKDPAAQTCPRCSRVLPPGAAKVCVFCGTPLTVTPAKSPSLGFGPRSKGDPLIGQTVAGRFKVEELIGQGGMGKVYRARHLALDRLVCLKMLKPALLEDPTLVGRFEREAKAASRLNHPNGIQVLDFGRNETDGALYIVMELVQGKDLRLVLRDDWPLPEERLCNIMAQVLAALAEAHAHNVIHRDLKPENIMIEQRRDQTDAVKVLDFGIAKILDSDMPGLTRADVVCGTPQYMAPEQATGSQLDARCDLYAVGVILYQMATGHLPFDGQNSMEVLTKHVNELPVPPRQRQPDAPISEAMEALILRALQKDPAQRPQTAEEFRQLLLEVPKAGRTAQLQAEAAGATPPHGTIPKGLPSAAAAQSVPLSETVRSKLQIYALAGGGALIVVALAAVLMLKPRRAVPATVPITVASPAPAQPAPAPAPPKQRDPEKAKELVTRAAEWQTGGDTGAARDLLLQAVDLDPDNAEAHYRLGGLFLNSQPDRARVEYEAAKRLNATRYADVVDTILKGL